MLFNLAVKGLFSMQRQAALEVSNDKRTLLFICDDILMTIGHFSIKTRKSV